VVFSINSDGTHFTSLHTFSNSGTNSYGVYTNSDGTYPQVGLISGGTIYGTAFDGGRSGYGTVFASKTDGTGFSVLHSFSRAVPNNGAGNPANGDGADPTSGLVFSGNTLYGMTEIGGSAGYGTIFKISLPLINLPAVSFGSGNVVLSWPTNAAGFALQSATNLGSATVWTTVLPAPVVGNGQNLVTNPVSGTQQFYRLSQ
jgi:uncharacterized repeat protein (TIGR03803 family)